MKVASRPIPFYDSSMNVSLFAAMGKNRELGFGNNLPWHLPDDLKRFKEFTRGHAVIMGRKTHESIGRALPDRKNIIITRNADYQAPGCIVVNSLPAAFAAAENDPEIFVIGGGEIYKLALPYADKLYLTSVDTEREADTFFPEFDEKEWSIIKEESHPADEKHLYSFVFRIYERVKA
jgi:dihydrofolate reductase